jgi:hypothetical protein
VTLVSCQKLNCRLTFDLEIFVGYTVVTKEIFSSSIGAARSEIFLFRSGN